MSAGERAGTHIEPGPQTSDADVWAGVRAALESGQLWRTVKGLAKESGLDRKQVEDLLVRYGSEVIRREGKSGQSRFASRDRVEQWRQRRANARAVTAESERRTIGDEDARAKVRKVLKKARMNPEYPLGRRSAGAILKATRLRRDLDAEQRRDYLNGLLAGQSDIERTEGQDGESWYALRERDDEVRLDERDQRRANYEALRALGVEPYPARFERPDTVWEIVDEHGGRSGEELEGKRPKTITAGRIVAIRSFGKANFLVLSDGKSRLQAYVREDSVSPRDFDVFGLLDVGDLVGVEGRIFRTRTKELTVWAERLEFLAKCFEPLPEKWNELADVETRYRQRYLDLIVNPASRQVFETRSRIIRAIRRFLDRREYVEVETPMMQPLAGGALARPFVTHHNALDLPLYLRVAPELYLKRLTVGGMERVYEINRNFRNEGISTRHNPEFTMLEFYEAYSDYRKLMELTKELLGAVADEVLGEREFTYDGTTISLRRFQEKKVRDAVREAVAARLGRQVTEGDLRDLATVTELARELDVDVAPDAGPGKITFALFEALCEDSLVQPTFVHDFPTEVSPLSKQKQDDPETVERFELYIAGMEIANAFSELNDPAEQRRRFEAQLQARRAGDAEAHAMDEDYIRALEHGLPPTGGEGIGIDRLVMLLTDRQSIRDVILFPLLRPQAGSQADAGPGAMNLPLELYISVRYLVARRKQASMASTSLISVLGVTVGVTALIVALALMTGLQQELRDRIVGAQAHVYVYKVGAFEDYEAEARTLTALPRVEAAAPAIQGKALARTAAGEVFINVKGIDPRLEETVTGLAAAVERGDLSALTAYQGPALGGVVIGAELARQLGAFVGDEVSLVTAASGTLSPMGVLPRPRRLEVVGIFRLGLLHYDTGYGFVTLDAARRLFRKDRVEMMQLRVDDPYAANAVAEALPEQLGGSYLTDDWSRLNSELFEALSLEKLAISIAIGLIVLVATLNIVSSLIMLVMEKSRGHRHPEDHGRRRPGGSPHLRAAGRDHRPHRDHGRRRRRLRHLHGDGPLQASAAADGGVPGGLRALHHRAARLLDRAPGGQRRLPAGDAASLPPRGPDRSGRGVALRVTGSQVCSHAVSRRAGIVQVVSHGGAGVAGPARPGSGRRLRRNGRDRRGVRSRKEHSAARSRWSRPRRARADPRR